MAQDDTSTPLSRRLLRLMRIAATPKAGLGVASLSHCIHIGPQNGRRAATYNIQLSPDDHGTFLVTCSELPEIATYGENEEEAMTMAQLAVEEALSTRRSSSDFPY